MISLRPAISIPEIEKEFSRRRSRNRLTDFFLNLLRKNYGTEILLEIPEKIQSFNTEVLPPLVTAEKLKSLGIIEKIASYDKIPDEPFAYRFRSFSKGPTSGTGISFTSEKIAAWKSLGESIERHLWYNSTDFLKKSGKIKTTYKNLTSRKKNAAIDIFSLAGFSEKQKNNTPILSFDKKTPFGWIEAIKFETPINYSKKIFCPIQLFSAIYASKNVRSLESNDMGKEPMLRWPVSTGSATGRCIEEALVNGILESIERDAFMINYLNNISPPIIDIDDLSKQDDDIARVINSFRRYNLKVYLLKLPTDFSVHIVSAVIIDNTGEGPAFSLGASADFDLKTCILDSLSESLAVRIGLKNSYKQTVSENDLDREKRLIYWANPKTRPEIGLFTDGPEVKVDLDRNFYNMQKESDYRAYYKEKLIFLTNELTRLGCHGCFCRLTTKEIEKLGFESVRVVIPKLHPVHLKESIPYFGGERLKSLPKKFGHSIREKLNPIPHPFP